MARLRSLGAFVHCPRCRYPMVNAKDFEPSEVGTALFGLATPVRDWIMGLGPRWGRAGGAWWGGFFTNTPLTWLDAWWRKRKWRRIGRNVLLWAEGLVCPNCMHFEQRNPQDHAMPRIGRGDRP